MLVRPNDIARCQPRLCIHETKRAAPVSRGSFFGMNHLVFLEECTCASKISITNFLNI